MAFPLELRKIPQADVYISKLYPNINFNGGSLLRCGRYYTQQNILT
ncbi:hypothetical protein [Clostridium sp. Marseille-Q2269]|nr:hypothetical protein [Clostridium sp. Marseille-Q2269]